MPAMAFASTPAACEPKAVTLDPEEVTAPERLAFVVTVAALPEMFPWMVEEKVLVPEKVLESASSVVEAMVMLAEPLKETPLIVRAVWSVVAVLALPPIEKEVEEVAISTSAEPAALV